MPSAPPAQHRILVYEYLTAGGEVPGLGTHAQAELLAQGLAMQQAMLTDLQAIPGLETTALTGRTDHAGTLAEAAGQGWTVWAVAPETGGTLERLARAVPAPRWHGCDPATIALTASKRATLRHLAAHGIAVPGAAARPGPPTAWIVKPDDGAGAADTRRHAGRAAAEADAARRPSPTTIEPWVDGEALSLSLCCGRTGIDLLAINRQHLALAADGLLHFQGVTPAAIDLDSGPARAIAPLVSALGRALPGLRGYVGVDLVLTPDGQPVVIEVNPRLTTAYVGLSARLGYNVAARLLAAA